MIEIGEERKKGLINGFIPKRGKGRNKADITLKTLYKMYEEEVMSKLDKEDRLEKRLILSESGFKEIIYFYLSEVMRGIKEDGDMWEVPCGNGRLYIEKMKMPIEILKRDNNLKVNYKLTNEERKKGSDKTIYHLNEHSGGCRYKWGWQKGKRIRGKNFYSFKPSRANARDLAKLIFQGKEYFS